MTYLVQQTAEFDRAVEKNLDAWVPACGGHEPVTKTRQGRRLLYCFNPAQQKHAYVDLGTDMVLSDDESNKALWG